MTTMHFPSDRQSMDREEQRRAEYRQLLFEAECERDLQTALRTGKMLDAVFAQLSQPRSNVIKFPDRKEGEQ